MSKTKTVNATIPAGWQQVVTIGKTIVGWPDWSDATALRSGAKVKTSHGDVHTASNEQTEVLFLLANEEGAHLEGARLRLTAWAFRRHRDVTATLEVIGGRSFVTISRVDAWPSDPHHNSYKARKKPGLAAIQGQVPGCHVHRFDDNLKYGPEAFGAGPEGNLPVATGLPNNLQSFRDFLRSVGSEFNVGGLEEFPSPSSWQGLV